MARTLSQTNPPPDPPTSQTESQLDCANGASNWLNPPSLLPPNDGDNPSGKAFSDRTPSNLPPNASNYPPNSDSLASTSEPLQGVQYVQQALFNIQASQAAFQEATRQAQTHHQRIRAEAAERQHIVRMQQFLESGDPILIAEAMAWAQVNPGVLQVNKLMENNSLG